MIWETRSVGTGMFSDKNNLSREGGKKYRPTYKLLRTILKNSLKQKKTKKVWKTTYVITFHKFNFHFLQNIGSKLQTFKFKKYNKSELTISMERKENKINKLRINAN